MYSVKKMLSVILCCLLLMAPVSIRPSLASEGGVVGTWTNPNAGSTASYEPFEGAWTNPNAGSTASYEPFDHYSTLKPAPTPTPTHTQTQRPQPVKDLNTDTTVKANYSAKDNGNGGITVEELGTYMCKVSYLGKTEVVLTAELSFGTVVPKDKQLAVIYTPKTGKASLRSLASANADILEQCKAGFLVSVMEYGKPYSRINYKNTVGYILTDCLKFYSVSEKTEGKGMLCYNGKTSGDTTVNIRLEADVGSRKIGNFIIGTEVTIIKYDDEWCEIEVGGLRGFIKTAFLMKI